jgi:hypothetical protein
MDEPTDGVAELRERVIEVRARVIESHRGLIAELNGLWHELNELAAGRPEVRRLGDEVAADIARLEKVDLALDTEWLADAKRAHREEPSGPA